MANRFFTQNVNYYTRTNRSFTHGLTLNGVGGAAAVAPTSVVLTPRLDTTITSAHGGGHCPQLVSLTTTLIRVKKRPLSDALQAVQSFRSASGTIDILCAVDHTYIR